VYRKLSLRKGKINSRNASIQVLCAGVTFLPHGGKLYLTLPSALHSLADNPGAAARKSKVVAVEQIRKHANSGNLSSK
jgi:hypothetical protein